MPTDPDSERLPDSFRIGVIGAGIAGLTCARRLHERGAKVTVFERNRRPGGRAGTHLAPVGRFDHGTQFFTVNGPVFESAVGDWQRARVVERWSGRVVELRGVTLDDRTDAVARYIGVEGMQSVARHLADGLDVRLDIDVDAVTRRGDIWLISDEQGKLPAPGGFDAMVIALPAPAAAHLLREAPDTARRAVGVTYDPCWTAMLAPNAASGFEFAAAQVSDNEVLAWATRDSAKSQAAGSGLERWVLHGTPGWSRSHLNMHAEDVASLLAQAFAERFNFSFKPAYLTGHCWLHARARNPLAEPFLWDPQRRIGATGDWCSGNRLEDAFVSGQALAAAIEH